MDAAMDSAVEYGGPERQSADAFLRTFMKEQLVTASNNDEASVSSVSTLVIGLGTIKTLDQASQLTCQKFFDALRASSNVVKVVFDCENDHENRHIIMDLSIYQQLGASLGAMPHLETLQVMLHDARMLDPIAQVLAGAKQISRLIWCCRMSQVDHGAIDTSSLRTCLQQHLNIHSAKVYAILGDGLELACDMVASAPNLTECDIGSLAWTNVRLSSASHVQALGTIMKAEAMADVSLHMVTFSTDAAADAFCETLAATALDSLICTEVSFDASIQRAVGAAMSRASIAKLVVQETKLTSEFLAGMADEFSLNCSTKIADLSRCNVLNNATDGLAYLLQQISCSETLRIFRPPCSNWDASLDKAWAECIEQGSLSDATIITRNDQLLTAPLANLAKALHSTHSLTSLRLEVSTTDEADYDSIADAVAGSQSSLHSLSLRLKHWTPHGIAAFLKKIRRSPRLKSLTFEVDYFLQPHVNPHKAVAIIVEAAKTCFQLTSLKFLSHDDLCDPLEWELNRNLQMITRLNASGRRYLLEENVSKAAGVNVLSAVNDNLNCLFLHLLENPQLCARSSPVSFETNESQVESKKQSLATRRKHLFCAFSLAGFFLNLVR